MAETDGSGGSGKVGIKDIAIAKRNEYQKLDAEFQISILPFTKSKVVNASVIPKEIKATSYSPPSKADNKKIKRRAVIQIKIMMLHLVNSFLTVANDTDLA